MLESLQTKGEIMPLNLYELRELEFSAVDILTSAVPCAVSVNLVSPIRNELSLIKAACSVDFVARNTEQDYVLVANSPYDSSYSAWIAVKGGSQRVAFDEAAWDHPSTISHEFMRALGLWHEQQRSDRDDLVRTSLDSTVGVLGGNPKSQDGATTYGPYDGGSIMQCDWRSVRTHSVAARVIDMLAPLKIAARLGIPVGTVAMALPLTLIASIFGMNVRVPGEGNIAGFWIILGVMVAVLLGMVAYFRKRGWL
jgi:hypothetical protein